MHYSAKPQRINSQVKNRNGQMPPTYNAGVHFVSAPNVSNSGPLHVYKKYINNMGSVNEVSVLQYQRAANMQIKNHNLEINHLQNMRYQQPPAFIYKTPQFHNQLNPHLQQKFPINNTQQRKLVKEQAITTNVLQPPSKELELGGRKSEEFLNQQEVKTLNNKAVQKNVKNVSANDICSRDDSKLLNKNTADVILLKNEEEVPISTREPDQLNGIEHGKSKTEIQQEMEQVLNINNEQSKKDHSEGINDKSTKDSREKTPMCLINDLARFNKISFQYRLTGENGPAHCKRFTVTLKLGDEEYTAEGFKIKKAQHLAAKEAIEKTKYKHPKPKTNDMLKSNITPTVELNALAMKLGQQTYYIFDPQKMGIYSNYSFATMQQQQQQQQQQPSNGMVENPINNGKQFQNLNQKRPFVSKFQHRFSPLQHSLQYTTLHADRTCFPSTSPCKITLLVGTKQFVGMGRTLQQAKHDAASNALQVLKEQIRNEQLETHGESTEDSDNKSPISLVFEMGIKRNLPVDFKVLREEGPAHMRTFITACTMGDVKTEGQGNGKKISKKNAAQKMIEELKKLPPLTPIDTPVKRAKLKISKKNSGDRTKNVTNLVEHKEGIQKTRHKKVNTESEADSPINKLLEWHQNKKKIEPVFKLINEFGIENSHRRQFVMEVSSNKIIARGVGNSKRMAKQDAARKCLVAITESEECPTEADGNDTTRTDNACKIKETVNACKIKETVTETTSDETSRRETCKTLLHNKESCQEQENVDKITTDNPSSTSVSTAVSKEITNVGNTSSKSKNLHMKDQLMYLSKLLSFDVEFSDYPKGNHNEFLTIVMLSTNPPQICHGVGVNAKESQEDAAKNALKILSEMGLNNAGNA